jgi:thiosulfate sulfurtransferase
MEGHAQVESTKGVPSVSVSELAKWLADRRGLKILDVRREPAFEKNPSVILGAQRVLPDHVDAWSNGNETVDLVVAYCVYGHEVSQGAVALLRARGYEAVFLEGGIHEWQLQGMPTLKSDA